MAEAAPVNELESLAHAGRAGIRVAVAESLTSGLLCSRIGEGEGASTWFAGGVVTYLTETKERLLGLTPGTDPCSADCAVQLATGARRLFQADVAVATTGVGGPDPEAGHPPGTVFVGWSIAGASGSQRLALDGGPDAVLAATVEHALGLLALHSRLALHLRAERHERSIVRSDG
jgi:PncC family amidohydrolase